MEVYPIDGLLFPIVMLVLTLLGGGVALVVMKSGKKKTPDSGEAARITAQEFINVKDIHDHYLYTRDGWVIAFVRIHSISTDLLSKTERRTLTKVLTAELSDLHVPHQYLAVSRPVDMSPIVTPMMERMAVADDKQRELLRCETVEMSTYALSGEMVERQFYLYLWTKFEDGCERDLYKQAADVAGKYTGCGVAAEVLEQKEIVRLCNLINNPGYTHLEDTDFDAAIPFIASGGV